MAVAPTVCGRFSYHLGCIGHVISAGMAAMDSGVAPSIGRLPSTFDSAASGLFTRGFPGFTSRSNFDRRAARERARGRVANAARIAGVKRVWVDRQPASCRHVHHIATRTRDLRPRRPLAGYPIDCLPLAPLSEIESALSHRLGRKCPRLVLAVDFCSSCDCPAANCFASTI